MYLLFAWRTWEASGGLNDLKGEFPTIILAETVFNKYAKENDGMGPRGQIVDRGSLEVVREFAPEGITL